MSLGQGDRDWPGHDEFCNVEAIASEKIGREIVRYVSNIYTYYLAFRMGEEERETRAKAKDATKQEAGA